MVVSAADLEVDGMSIYYPHEGASINYLFLHNDAITYNTDNQTITYPPNGGYQYFSVNNNTVELVPGGLISINISSCLIVVKPTISVFVKIQENRINIQNSSIKSPTAMKEVLMTVLTTIYNVTVPGSSSSSAPG